MKLSKSLNKLLIAGLALVTITATGASASNINVSAKRRPRIHRVAKHIRRHTKKHVKKVNKKTTRKNRKAHKVSRASNGSYNKGKQYGTKVFNLIKNGLGPSNKHVMDPKLKAIVYGGHASSKSWSNGFNAGTKSAFNKFVHNTYKSKEPSYDMYDRPNSTISKNAGIKDTKAIANYMTNYASHHSKSMTAKALIKYMNKRLAMEVASVSALY